MKYKCFFLLLATFCKSVFTLVSICLKHLALTMSLCFQIMGYKIYTYEIHSSYAARVDNYRSYDTISKDIIQRWTYPLVPDVLLLGNSATKLEREGIYRASGMENIVHSHVYNIGLPIKLTNEESY